MDCIEITYPGGTATADDPGARNNPNCKECDSHFVRINKSGDDILWTGQLSELEDDPPTINVCSADTGPGLACQWSIEGDGGSLVVYCEGTDIELASVSVSAEPGGNGSDTLDVSDVDCSACV